MRPHRGRLILTLGVLSFVEQSGANTWVSCDVDGAAAADFQILFTGTINFTANDFLF
jgi:hypothetical protein